MGCTRKSFHIFLSPCLCLMAVWSGAWAQEFAPAGSRLVAAPGGQSLVIRDGGGIWGWGSGNSAVLGGLDTADQAYRTNRFQTYRLSSDTNWQWLISMAPSAAVTFGIRNDGSLWGWGPNNLGQLGDGTGQASTLPVPIAGTNRWLTLSACQDKVFAIRTDGTLWAWGNNPANSGSLGIGRGRDVKQYLPVRVGTLGDWRRVQASFGTALSLTNTNSVTITNAQGEVTETVITNIFSRTSGSGGAGIRGNGELWAWGTTLSTRTNFHPVRIGTDDDWRQVVFGPKPYALKQDFTLWEFDSVTEEFTQVGAESDWSVLAGSASHMLAVKTDGTLWAWGANGSGQLGDDTKVDRAVPIQIGVESDWIDISAGPVHSIAMKADGSVWAWGATGYFSPHQRVPHRIGAERTWQNAVAGSDYSLGVDGGGALFAWGFTDLTNPAVFYVPTEISPTNRTDSSWTNSGWTNGLTAYRRKIVALDPAGGLRIWGDAFGDYPGDDRTNPVVIPPDLDQARAWWDPERYEPGWIERDGPWLAVSGNSGTSKEGNAASGNLQPEGFAAAVRADGTLWTWGANTNGQLGDGTRIPKDLPLRIGTATNWSGVEAGGSHILASRRDGSLWGWGANTNGELGLTTNLVRVTNNFSSGSTNTNTIGPAVFTGRTRTTTILLASNVHTPRPIFSKGWGVREFSAGGSHSLVLGSNGTLWSMGANEQGQLGLGEVNRPAGGTNTNGSIRRAVTNLFTNIASVPPRVEANVEVVEDQASMFKPRRLGRQLWKSIAAGDRHSLGVRQDGTLWSWGDNGNAQLGNGTLVGTNQPHQIGAGNRWAGVFAGKEHSLALQEDGSLWAWGKNDGRLGIPRPSPSYVPERVDFGPAGQATILLWAEGRNRGRLTGSGLAAFFPRSGAVNLSLALESGERGKQEWSGQSETAYAFPRGQLHFGKKIGLSQTSDNGGGGSGTVVTNQTGDPASFLLPRLEPVPGRPGVYLGSATIDGIACRVQFAFDGDGDGDGIPDVADASPLGGAPRLASAKKARATLGEPFTYELTAEGGVVSPILGTTLSRLPQGLSYGPQEIQGVPVDDPANLGTYRVVVGASNDAGESFQTLSLDVVPPAPEITSADTLAWTQGISPFAFRITATNDSYPGYPVRYSATDLPRGLRLDPASGWIQPGRGSPLDLPLSGSYRVRLVAAHAAGASTNFLNLTVSPPGAEEWTAGAPLIYTARFLPGAMVSAAGLPAGLRIHPRTGLISGIPEQAGLFEVEVVSRSRTAIETNRILLPIRIGRPELVGSRKLAFTGTAALSRNEHFRYQISARSAGQPWAGASDFPPRLSSDWGNARSFGANLTQGTATLRYVWSSSNAAFASLEWNRPLPLDTAWQVSVDAGFATNHLSGVLSGDESLALMLLALKDSSDLSGERDFVSTYLEGNTNVPAGAVVAEAVVDGTTNGAVGVAAVGGQGVLSLLYQPTNLAAVSRTDATDTNSVWTELQTNSLATWTNSAGSNSVILRLMGQSEAPTNLVGLVPYFSRFVVTPLEGLSYSSSNLPAGLSLDPNTGLIYGTPLSSISRHSAEVVISNLHGTIILPVVFEIK